MERVEYRGVEGEKEGKDTRVGGEWTGKRGGDVPCGIGLPPTK